MNTVYDNSNYGTVLVKDGKETFCPFQPPIPMPNENGGFTIMRLPCSTNCPHASIKVDNELPVFEITCGKEKISYPFTWEKADGEQNVVPMKKV